MQKTIEEFKNKIIQGDCLEVLKEIPDNSVDCIITEVESIRQELINEKINSVN